MKMIRHQAPSQYIGMRQYTLSNFFKKEQVVLSIEKHGLRIIPTVKHMINLAVTKFHPFLASI
jgi:hypothetical protein